MFAPSVGGALKRNKVILKSNLPEIIRRAHESAAVLDVGGWHCPLNSATHVLDLMPYETRRTQETLDPNIGQRFSEKTWIMHDACKAPWPFPDKFFDFSFCSHLLEDVEDPITVCQEIVRTSKSGYIETPSREREIFSKSRFFSLKSALGQRPEIGFSHHNWFVELDGGALKFTRKDPLFSTDKGLFITRAELGRKLSERESGLGLFWRDSFGFRQEVETVEGLAAFKKSALMTLRAQTPA